MAINTLYLSPPDFEFNSDPSKTFLTSKNLKTIVNKSEHLNCITSIADLGGEHIKYAVDHAKNIVLIGINTDYVLNIPSDISFVFFAFIKLAQEQQKISLEQLSFLDAIDTQLSKLTNVRSSDSPVLWSVGCSITYGFGVSPDQRYGKILSNLLELEEVALAKSGSSIFWAADQILRSDIKKDDIVVWGITNSCRINYNDQFNLESTTIRNYKDIKDQFWSLDYFDSIALTISNYKQILQVINYCKKVGAKLFLVNLLDGGLISLLLKKYNNFIDLHNEFLDYGSDNIHPGPKQHQHYADKILDLIYENNCT